MADIEPESKTSYLSILDDKNEVTGVMIIRPVPNDDRGTKELVLFGTGHSEPFNILFTPDELETLIEALKA